MQTKVTERDVPMYQELNTLLSIPEFFISSVIVLVYDYLVWSVVIGTQFLWGNKPTFHRMLSVDHIKSINSASSPT